MDSSLNLNTLASSLPSPYQNAEKDLLNNFKAAALSITTLYRSSRNASKRAYNAGYASACNDLLLMIQQGVSAEGIEHSQSHDSGSSDAASSVQGKGMTIGKVMDWIEARIEAIKSREEEEDEEEERERERERVTTSTANAAGPAAATNSSSKSIPVSKPPVHAKSTKEQPPTTNHAPGLPMQSHSPSPPPTTRQAQRNHNKSSRTQAAKTDSSLLSSPLVPSVDRSFPLNPTTLNFASDDRTTFSSVTSASPPLLSTLSPFPDHVPAVSAGAKRRHAVMMMLDSSSTSPSPTSVGSSTSPASSTPSLGLGHHGVGSRRRTRSTRSNTHNLGLNVNLGLAPEAMDVEEDGQGGRERKRVTRR